MPEPTGLPSLLQVAIKRRYLDADIAARIAAESRRTRTPLERLLVERGLLSKRRLERLMLHVRYRTLRAADKSYARAALRAGYVKAAELDAGLAQQRALFESDREVVRLGAILVDRGSLTASKDRALREQVSALGDRASGVVSAVASGASAIRHDDESGSAATLLEASSSKTPLPGASSYRQIDAALARVEAVRAAQEDLSTSEDGKAGPDSAAEFENACRMLARRRFDPEAAKAKSKASRPAIRLGA